MDKTLLKLPVDEVVARFADEYAQGVIDRDMFRHLVRLAVHFGETSFEDDSALGLDPGTAPLEPVV